MRRIERARRARGLSRYRLAMMARVTEGALRKWERGGIARAQCAAVLRVARELGLAIEDLIDEEDAG